MKNFRVVIIFISFLLTACGNSPGALEGTWKANGPLPLTVMFRPGETEMMGVIEPVEYRSEGNTVLVIYKDGLMKGSSMRFVLVDRNTATNPMYTLHRVH